MAGAPVREERVAWTRPRGVLRHDTHRVFGERVTGGAVGSGRCRGEVAPERREAPNGHRFEQRALPAAAAAVGALLADAGAEGTPAAARQPAGTQVPSRSPFSLQHCDVRTACMLDAVADDSHPDTRPLPESRSGMNTFVGIFLQ